MPGAAIECVEMNWVKFISGGFLLGRGRSCASLRPRHLCFLHIASLPQPTALYFKVLFFARGEGARFVKLPKSVLIS